MAEVKAAVLDSKEQYSSVREHCKAGRFLDALNLAQSYWGNLNNWSGDEQKLLAIRISANLGGDRLSDVLLLKEWRKNERSPELLERVFYYKLNKLGPILCSEFISQYESCFEENKQTRADLLAFKSIIRRIYEDYSGAERLLQEAEAMVDSRDWLYGLRVNVLSAQGEHAQAFEQAEKLYLADNSQTSIRNYARTLLETQGAVHAIALYEKHIDNFQSLPMLFDYGLLLANNHKWDKVAALLPRIEALRQFDDKHDTRTLNSWRGQLAIHRGETEQAITILSKLKSPYWDIVVENLKNKLSADARTVLDVPFIRQKHMTCAPTTLAALGRFWGRDYDEDSIADEICYDGTPDTKERQWLRDNDFVFREFELESELAYRLIESSIPFALVTGNGFSAHMQAVIGCNRQQGTLYIMDPSCSGMQETLTKETITYNGYSGARCMAFVPSDKADLLEGFEFPASDLYEIWGRYTISSEKNDHHSAKQSVDDLVDAAPNHRITLKAQRSLAIWNSDTAAILECNTKLLDKFPDEGSLHSSSYYCYRDLGQREQGLRYLDSYLTDSFDLDVTGILFGEIFDTNSHTEIAGQCLKKLKRFGGSSAKAHWLIASDAWNKAQHRKATEHYFIAHCLEQTNEQYIESYFKASRFIAESERALELLTERYEKYKVRSPLPAISLYRAYDILGQEHLGLEVLMEALNLHHNDRQLVAFLAEKLVDNGLFEKLESIKAIVQRSLDHESYQFLIATAHEKQGHYELALKIYQSQFERFPYVNKYGSAYYRVLYTRGEKRKINSSLEALYQKEPNNSLVLDLITDWHSDPEFLEQVLEHFSRLRPDHGAIRRQLIGVRLKLGKHPAALAEAKLCCQHLPGELSNKSYLAYCYQKMGEHEQALTISRQVLEKSVDNEMAFDVLLNSSHASKDKKDALIYVITQIKAQVVTGESPWNLWYAAKSVLDKSLLEDFCTYLLSSLCHHWYSYSIAASFYMQYSELDSAQKVLVKGIDKFPLTPRLYNDMAQLCEYQNDSEAALKYYQKTLELNPAWSAISRKICEIYEKQGDIDSAAKVIKTAIKYSATDGVLYGFYADILIGKGMTVEAIKALRKAVSYQPSYRWAWDQLKALAPEPKGRQLLLEFANELAVQSPYMAISWNNLAYLADSEEQKLHYMHKAIECDEFYIGAYEDKARYYLSKADYKLALDVLDHTPWGDDLPEELAVMKADLLSGIGNKPAAVETLDTLLSGLHGFPYLWKKLFDMLGDDGDQEQLRSSLEKAIDRNPHDAEILCYSAEHLYRLDKNKARAIELLERAFSLASNNQYVVLTYVDVLIGEESYQSALDCLADSGAIREVQYAWAREVFLLSKLERFSDALAMFQQFYKREVSDYWCLNYGFKELLGQFEMEFLCKPYLDEEHDFSKLQAFFFADKIIYSNECDKRIIKLLPSIKEEACLRGSLLALAEFWREKRSLPPQKVIDQYEQLISQDSDILAQLSICYMNTERYYTLLKLYGSYQCELPAYVHYYASFGLLMSDRRKEAYQAVVLGMDSPPDFSSHNLRLWFIYFQLIDGTQVSLEELAVIDQNELVNYEKYILNTLRVSATRAERTLASCKDELSPLLRDCQFSIQDVANHKLAVAAKKRLRQELASSIAKNGFWATLKLKWWLSNHF